MTVDSTRRRPSRRLLGAAAAVATGVGLALVLRAEFFPSPRPTTRGPTDLRNLAAAVAQEPTRPIDGRLTGGFRYAPPPSASRASSARRPSPDVQIAAARIEQAFTRDQTYLPAMATARLVMGDVDGAVIALERVVSTDPSNAAAQSDLAAAYLARAGTRDHSEDWPSALAAADRAIRLRPDLAEAQFNRALALEALALRSGASGAWSQVLAHAGGDGWGQEADQHARRLSAAPPRLDTDTVLNDLLGSPTPEAVERLIDADGLLARELVEDRLLPMWGDAVLAKRSDDAARLLAAADLIAQGLQRTVGDGLTVRVVAAARSCCHETELARAHLTWRAARAAYARNEPKTFGALFHDAAVHFTVCASPMALWARHYEVVRQFLDGRLDGARTVANELAAAAASSSPALVGRIEWDLGSIAFQQERFEESVAFWLRALARFEASHERDNIAVMNQSIAEAFGRLGDHRESWRRHIAALRLGATVREIRRRQAVFTGPGYTLLNAYLPEAAAEFFAEARELPGTANDPNYRFEAEVGIGRSAALAGDEPRALAFLESAAQLESRVTYASYRARFGADLRLAQAQIALDRREHDRVVQLTDEVLSRVTSVSSEYRLAQLYLMRGRAQLAMGNASAARAQFERGIEHLESKRALLQQSSLRISYLDTAWDLYGDIVSLVAIQEQQPREALAWADRARARALTEWLTPGRPDTVDRLGADQAVVFISTTDHDLLLWVVTRARGIEFHRTTVGPALLETLATALDESSADRRLAKLRAGYDLLIRPLEALLSGVQRVTIVPDARTQRVPCAALWDATRNQYVVDRVAIDVSPSLETTFNREPSERTPTSLAVFVDPAENALDDLPALPFARREAADIARLYPRSTSFAGQDASFESLSRALDRFDVVHVGVHTIANPQYPGSRLALVGSPEILNSAERIVPHARTRVVVLAACQTAAGPPSRGEVLMNLARPFLLRGVEHVVITLRDVPDRETSEFVTDFHRRLTNGSGVATALAETQRAARAQGMSSAVWGAFIVVSVQQR